MPTVFENLGDRFYTAFFEPDPDQRRAALENWIKEATPVIQSAVENDIRAYIKSYFKNTWTQENWKAAVKKFSGLRDNALFMDSYKLYLDIKLRPKNQNEEEVVVGTLSPEVRSKTLDAARRAIPDVKPVENPSLQTSSPANVNNGDDGDYSSDDDGGRSPNDDRSDSMNPNNDSYHAAMDNHSNQMNPNNDAYWSSRGR